MEMLAVVLVLGVLLVPLARLTAVTVKEIPCSYRTANINTSLLSAVQQMGRDINRAVEFPESCGGFSSDSRTLLIKLSDGCVCYRLDGKELVRYNLTDSDSGQWEQSQLWTIPKAVISWKLPRKGNKVFAVELQKHIVYRSGDVVEKKLSNSYVFFAGAYPEPIE
jgi:hypothetical protein